jgi:hypothetical protein
MAVSESEDREAKRRQRMRSVAIACVLGFLVIAFYAATIVRLGGNVAKRTF